jgi:hypothetical protein
MRRRPLSVPVPFATSLLYGTTRAQRRAALAADEPEALPWIAQAVTRLGTNLRVRARVSGS